MIDGRVHHDAPDPALEGTLPVEPVHAPEDLDEAILKDVLRLVGVLGVAQAYGQHLPVEGLVDLLLTASVPGETSIDELHRDRIHGNLHTTPCGA